MTPTTVLHHEALDRYRLALAAAREADADVVSAEKAFIEAKGIVKGAYEVRTRTYEALRDAEEWLDKALGGRPRPVPYCAACDSSTCGHTGTRRAA